MQYLQNHNFQLILFNLKSSASYISYEDVVKDKPWLYIY